MNAQAIHADEYRELIATGIMSEKVEYEHGPATRERAAPSRRAVYQLARRTSALPRRTMSGGSTPPDPLATAADDQQKRTVTVLLVDASMSGAGADRAPPLVRCGHLVRPSADDRLVGSEQHWDNRVRAITRAAGHRST
jgi:hypothetical protein